MSLLDSEIELIDKISTKDLIIEWLEKYDIKNYKINDDLTIDVNKDVWLNKYPESQLPEYIQFNEIIGYFNIANSQIKTLKGCPKIVKGNFICSGCGNLESLVGAPEKIIGSFYCCKCNSLKSLKGSPKLVNEYFNCSFCTDLKTLEGAPKKVKKDFYCSYCNSLKSLKGAPEIVDAGFYCYGCPKLKTTEFDCKKYNIIK